MKTHFLIFVLCHIPEQVKWDGAAGVAVEANGFHYGKTCGLCGDFNGDKVNDFTAADKSVKATADEFGKSWERLAPGG